MSDTAIVFQAVLVGILKLFLILVGHILIPLDEPCGLERKKRKERDVMLGLAHYKTVPESV